MIMKLLLVIGTRPQIIKSIPLIKAAEEDGVVDLSIIHTGQHYDYEMTAAIFDGFSLPAPDVNLEVGSHPPVKQTALIMSGLNDAIKAVPDIMVVPGDTNSALAAALVASKRGIPLAHMEAGARSYDMRMQEEVNRRLIDHCSDILFTTTANCAENLLDEGVRGKISLVGDTMLDLLYETTELVDGCDIVGRLGLEDYHLLTVHRAENVDNKSRLTQILGDMNHLKKVVFPIHPRTSRRLDEFGVNVPPNIMVINPVGYIEMMKLIKQSNGVSTDSGGLQKEAFWLGKLENVIRAKHEWPETEAGCVEDFGLGDAAHRILEELSCV